MIPRRKQGGLVRPYVVTQGRAHPTRDSLDLVTLVIATLTSAPPDLSPEKRRIVELCSRALSIAEVAGYLALPVSVTKVLVADLVDQGHIAVRSRARRPQHDVKLIEEVLRGLRALT